MSGIGPEKFNHQCILLRIFKDIDIGEEVEVKDWQFVSAGINFNLWLKRCDILLGQIFFSQHRNGIVDKSAITIRIVKMFCQYRDEAPR